MEPKITIGDPPPDDPRDIAAADEMPAEIECPYCGPDCEGACAEAAAFDAYGEGLQASLDAPRVSPAEMRRLIRLEDDEGRPVDGGGPHPKDGVYRDLPSIPELIASREGGPVTCMHCDATYGWQPVEGSTGICDTCLALHYPEEEPT